MKDSIETDSGQKLVRVGIKERKAILDVSSTNRRARQNYVAQLQRQKGPTSCAWCGAEPCGALWTRASEPEPGGDRCCERCTHEPVEGWVHTHSAWLGGQHFPVCALRMKEGETIYLRRDGTVQFFELRAPKPGALLSGEVVELSPVPVFLGRTEETGALTLAGEGGDQAVNLWLGKAAADPLWLVFRMQAALAAEEERRRRAEAELAEREAELDRLHAQAVAEREAKQRADMDKRALKHEVVTVLREQAEIEEVLDPSAGLSDVSLGETRVQGEDAGTDVVSPPERDRVAEWRAEQADLSPADLKKPAPPMKTGGRLRRSGRQKVAVERKKRVAAMREAKARLELKRFQRAVRAGVEEAPPPGPKEPTES